MKITTLFNALVYFPLFLSKSHLSWTEGAGAFRLPKVYWF